MYSAKIITLCGEHNSYRLRRVQSPVSLKAEAPEEVQAILQACSTEAELLDFFFTTDYPVNEAFILLFEKRLQELECPFQATTLILQNLKQSYYGTRRV